MPALLLVLLVAAAVKDGPAPLRSGCSPDARVVASLPTGAPVTIKYSINGEAGPCYKVSVQVDGKTLEGSLPATALSQRLIKIDATEWTAGWRPALIRLSIPRM